MKLWYIKSYIKMVLRFFFEDSFFSYQFYPNFNKIKNFPINTEIQIKTKLNFSIVMQGPLVQDKNFTIETLKIYRNNFPDANIVLSTWSLKKDEIKILKKLNIKIFKNIKPKNPGISNINLQIISSRNGILEAKKIGAKFVLKTRTDQRVYHPNLKNYLFNFIYSFPLKKKYILQKHRLVAISLGTFKYRLYGISDMFLFGHIDDLLKYFNPPLDLRIILPKKKVCNLTWMEYSKLNMGEVYFCTNFLKKIGRKIKFTLADSFDVYRDHFVILDHETIKLYWHKYTLNKNRYEHFNLFESQLTFVDWMILYNLKNSFLLSKNIANIKC